MPIGGILVDIPPPPELDKLDSDGLAVVTPLDIEHTERLPLLFPLAPPMVTLMPTPPLDNLLSLIRLSSTVVSLPLGLSLLES